MRDMSRRAVMLVGSAAALLPLLAHAQEALRDMGPAPEFKGISTWLNSPRLTMAELRGKVVLIDFWTYSCINCLRTLPYVTRWYDQYKDKASW